MSKKQAIIALKPYLKTVLDSNPDLINYIDILPNGSNIIFRQSRIPQSHRQQYARLYRQATLLNRTRTQAPTVPINLSAPYLTQNLSTRQMGSISSTSRSHYEDISDTGRLTRQKQVIVDKMKTAGWHYSITSTRRLLDEYPVSVLLTLLSDNRNFTGPHENSIDFLSYEILLHGFTNHGLLFENVIYWMGILPLSRFHKSQLYRIMLTEEYNRNRKTFPQIMELLIDYQPYMNAYDRSRVWLSILRMAVLFGEATIPQIRRYLNRRNLSIPEFYAELQQFIQHN